MSPMMRKKVKSRMVKRLSTDKMGSDWTGLKVVTANYVQYHLILKKL